MRSRLIRFLMVVLAPGTSILGAQGQDGQQIFSTTCAPCHGLDARGGEHAPDIATPEKVQLATESELLRTIQRGIPSQGMPGFGKTLTPPQLQAVVNYLRKLQGKGESSATTGDAAAGKSLFLGKAKCADCHTVNGQGGFIGNDLSSFGMTHSAQEIRDAIIAPDKNLSPRAEIVIATTAKGETFTGIARNEDNFSLQLQGTDGTLRLFDKASLVQVEHQRRPLMPNNYGAALTRSEIDDLVAYLAKMPR